MSFCLFIVGSLNVDEFCTYWTDHVIDAYVPLFARFEFKYNPSGSCPLSLAAKFMPIRCSGIACIYD